MIYINSLILRLKSIKNLAEIIIHNRILSKQNQLNNIGIRGVPQKNITLS